MKIIKILIVLFVVLGFQSCKSQSKSDLKDGLYAEITTDKGNMLVALEYQKTPITVANFVSLAEGSNKNVEEKYKGKKYYDGLTFHRVVPNFVIQGGDPLGNGSGGPGYRFEDEFPKDANRNLLLKHDSAGILSMANSGKETNGSQFFITHNATPHLDGRHTVFGKVIEGLEVVNKIAQGDIIKKIEIIKVGKEAKKFDAASVFDKALADFNGKTQKVLDEAKAVRENLPQTESAQKQYFEEQKAKAKTLPSGLKMTITQKGAGEKPAAGSKVLISYAGYFENGKLFDSNWVEIAKKNAQYNAMHDSQMGYMPFEMVYSNEAGLVPGFKEGMLNMNYGDKALLFIPAHLAYGEQGAGNVIPPNSNLVFEVEVLKKQ